MSKEYPSRQRAAEIKLSQKKKTKDLFEDLARLSGCEYIADLRLKKNKCICVLNALREINADDYTLHEWKDAAEYLVGQHFNTESRDEIRKLIILNHENQDV